MAQTLRDVLAGHAARQPQRPFLIAPETGRVLSYGEIERQARILARFLAASGLKRGDKVALYLHNGYQAALLFLSAMIGGYVVVPMNLLSQRSQLAYVLGHCDCRLLFTSLEYEKQLAEALADTRRAIEVIVIDSDAPSLFLEDRLPSGEFEPVSAEDPALLMYWHGLTPQDRCLSSLPIYHINGQVIATLTPFVSGGSLVAPHRFSVTDWWNLVERFDATWINMVPTIIAYLLNAADSARTYRFPRLRFGRSASSPLPPEHHKAFERTFGVPVIECMGMTETSSVAFANLQDPAKKRYGSLGLPCGIEARVVDGELQLRGPNVMRAYYKSPEQSAKAFAGEGWLRSGDLGHRDADGYYYITGRLKELIIKGGENIAPREIDEALLRHPAVLEAAAVGVPDKDYGQEILACIVVREGSRLAESELRAFCLAELGRYKTPKLFRFVAELPKGPSGKVQRLKLAELA
jgi:acyl-CoA synthetase (AMP-forming)/AMP-acid ligase II